MRKHSKVWLVSIALGISYASSILVDSTLPFYMKSLGVSTMLIAGIEGVVLFLTFISKFVGASLTDYIGKRKPVAVFGLLVTTLVKPLYGLFGFLPFIIFNKSVDRISQGIFKGPSDALIGDIAVEEGGEVATSYGIRETCARAGAVVGTLLGVFLMTYFVGKYHIAFYIAGFLSLISLLFFWYFAPNKETPSAKIKGGISLDMIADIPRKFWFLMLFIFMAQGTHFATPILLLRGVDVGISQSQAPFIISIMFFVGSASAIKVGKIADKIGHWVVYLIGLLVLATSHFLIAKASHALHMYLAIILWGLYLAIIQTSNCALVVDNAPEHLRGTGFGIFKVTVGSSILVGNMVGGYLWDTYSSSAPFYFASIYLYMIIIPILSYTLYAKTKQKLLKQKI